MRFSATHKLTTYLMVVASLASLWLSPEVAQATKLVSAVAVLLSWFVEPPRVAVQRFTAFWNVATLVFFVYLVIGLFHDAPVITTGVRFLLFVLINKLFNRISSKDYRQIYVISFLVLVAATTLNTDISYALCFSIYVIAATWALTLFHLRREIEENYLLRHADGVQSEKVEVERILNSRRIVGPKFLGGTALVSLGVLLSAAVVFVVFPRVGFGLFLGHRRSGVVMVGFREKVQLGHHGVIRDNPQVVMRVWMPREETQRALYWRGTVYDTYRDGEWSLADDVQGLTEATRQLDGLDIVDWRAPGRPQRGFNARFIRQRLLRHKIQREPMESNVLFAADRPVALEVERNAIGRPVFMPRRGPFNEIRGKRMSRAGVQYTAYSLPYRPSAAVLRRAQQIRDPNFRAYLQFPQTLPPRVKALALRITKDKATLYDKVVAVEQYLKANYRYTLQLTHDKQLEPVDEFLFSTRQGHCEYFASAMALLVRAAGVHTRQVNGFVGGEWNQVGKFLAVKHSDAHAWVEVYFHGVGWVRFDPTPSGLPPRAYQGLAGWLRQVTDAARMRWFYYVVEYDLGKQIQIFREASRIFSRPKDPGGLTGGMRPVLGLLALALLGLMLYVLWRRHGHRLRLGVGKGSARTRASGVSLLYSRLLKVLARGGLAKAPGLTPREFASQLSGSSHGVAALVERFTTLYYDVRYGARELSSERSREFNELLQQIRAQLKAGVQGPAGKAS